MRQRCTAYMLVFAAGLELACRPGPSNLPIVAAAERGDLVELRALLASGADIEAIDARGWTAVVAASRDNRDDALTTLLEAGADPNHRDERNGWPPVMHALHTNQAASVRTLLDFGADPNQRSRSGRTPLVMVAGYGRPALVALLMDYGADPTLATGEGSSALTAAVMGSSDIDRFTLGQCQTETVKTLLERAPDLQLGNQFWDRLAARLARWRGCSDVLTLLDQR